MKIAKATTRQIKGTPGKFYWVCPCGKRISCKKYVNFRRKVSQEKFSCKVKVQNERKIIEFFDVLTNDRYNRLLPCGTIITVTV